MPNKKKSLCWYCKRTIDENLRCPWVDLGKAVRGWKVEDSHAIPDSNISIGEAETHTVLECPLFVFNTHSIIFSEYINQIAEEIGAVYSTAHYNPRKVLDLYTEKTGNGHPEWVMEELKLAEENCALTKRRAAKRKKS